MTKIREYRGTKEFYRVLKECIETAEHQGFMYYPEVAKLIPGVPERGGYMAGETAAMSGAISEAMHENGHPMLSAVIVKTNEEVPGEGFYKFAHELGKLETSPENMNKNQKLDFWENELDRVYDHWDPNQLED